MVTAYPLEVNSFPSDAEIIPLPNEDVTPPVTKIYFVGNLPTVYNSFDIYKNTICEQLFLIKKKNY